ncbi:carbohydrate porin [Acinetobacter baumannii]|nr:carbohydrate porin [Acinetobacter baumannii]
MSKKVLMKGFTICTIALNFDVFAQDASYTNNLTHDWDKKRSQLQENGVQIIGNYMHELGYNVSGGYNTDKKLEYANEILLGADFDLQKIINIPNAYFKVILTNRNGQDITNTRIINPEGGQLTSVQEVWGRGSITRLAELSYRQTFMDNKLNLRVGRFGFGEFGEFSCEFQNLLFCGNSSGSNTGSLIYNFPVSQWAIQAKYKLTDSLTAQTAIFEQNPTLQENDNAFKISTSGSKGIIIPLEFIYQDKEADSKLRLGGYFSTANAVDVYKDIQGNPKARTHLSAKEHEQRYGFWAMYQRNIVNLYSDNARPLELFSQVHYNDKDTSYIGNSVNIGLLGKGLFQQRPQDIFGIAIGRIGVNSDYKKNIELQNIIHNFSVPVQNYEISTELFYGVNLQNGIVIRPNIQYIKNPGGVKETEDAVVAGLKVSVAL